ncbi:hypothetical protein [Clostridium sp. KNHs214]|uniref:hypothetical protein n=1 Tax=Clostridium sp. KNHs214 TaxID=1540257 RepID=UPI0005506A88|nr:hypothetical protein [Clostridium sp. KNHs214]
MDKKTIEYMERRVKRYRELEGEVREAQKLTEKLEGVKDDRSLIIYIDGKQFALTPRMIKAVKNTMGNEYNLVVLESEKEMEDL